MIDFSVLLDLIIPEGEVAKIENEIGQVLWVKVVDDRIILQVEKITSDTYAGETTYKDEQFILLDIYPKNADSTIQVSYGGLTKTLTFSGMNAQQVFFGTFNGVSDSVATPTSGVLTIEGECETFACGTYKNYNTTTSKSSSKYCSCITKIVKWGNITSIGNYAFYECTNLTLTSLPSGITSIGDYAFSYCAEWSITEIPEGVTSIGREAFLFVYGDTPDKQMIPFKVEHIRLPSTLKSLGDYALSIICEHPNSADPETQMTLKTLTINAKTPPSANNISGTSPAFLGGVYYNGVDAVGGIAFKIIVPKGCGEAYKAAEGWSQYAKYIVEAS